MCGLWVKAACAPFLFFVFPESLMATFVIVYTPVNFMIVSLTSL